jgi:hypothetical protein
VSGPEYGAGIGAQFELVSVGGAISGTFALTVHPL